MVRRTSRCSAKIIGASETVSPSAILSMFLPIASKFLMTACEGRERGAQQEGGGPEHCVTERHALRSAAHLPARGHVEHLLPQPDRRYAVGDGAADPDLEHSNGVVELPLEECKLLVGQELVGEPAAQSRGDADEDEHDDAQEKHRWRLREVRARAHDGCGTVASVSWRPGVSGTRRGAGVENDRVYDVDWRPGGLLAKLTQERTRAGRSYPSAPSSSRGITDFVCFPA